MIDRALAHDLRGVIAAAASNVEFAREHALPREVVAALVESSHELRVAADVIALLGSKGDRELEIDLRAAILAFRGERAIAVDATQPPFVIRGTSSVVRALAEHLCDVAPRGRLEVDGDGCSLSAAERSLDPARLAAVDLTSVVTDGLLVLRREAAD